MFRGPPRACLLQPQCGSSPPMHPSEYLLLARKLGSGVDTDRVVAQMMSTKTLTERYRAALASARPAPGSRPLGGGSRTPTVGRVPRPWAWKTSDPSEDQV